MCSAWWTHYLNSVSAAGLVRPSFSLLFLELNGYSVNDVQLHVRRRRPGQAQRRQGRLQIKTIQAEAQHRDHAVVEQVFADLSSGPLAHLPSGHFPANAAWLTLAAICHNLTRAAGTLAGPFHARARGATIRRQLITVAARIARHGRGQITVHLPEGWHREHEWMNLFHAACGPHAAAA